MNGTFLGAKPGTAGDAVVLGVPFDHGSIHSAGCAQAPATLRSLTAEERAADGIWDFATRSRVLSKMRLSDFGDVAYGASFPRTGYFGAVESAAARIARRAILVGLGGDHSVTLPLARGVARAHGPLQIVQLDAHHDYAPVRPGRMPTHSNFVTFLARVRAIRRIVQVGVRGYSSYLPRRPARVVDVRLGALAAALDPGVPTYLTIDTDAFDPSIAPAVVHPLPGGLAWSDLDIVLDAIFERGCPIVAVDWTEYNPMLDRSSHPTGMAIVFALIRILARLEKAH